MGLFSKKMQKAPAQEQPQKQEPAQAVPEMSEELQNRVAEVFFKSLEEKRRTDPLIGAKLGSKEIFGRLQQAVADPDGRVNVNILLLHLSALAGMACQMTCRQIAVQNGKPEEAYFVAAGTKDGRRYFLGDALNKYLLEGQYSLWSLAAGIYQHLKPDAQMPDPRPWVTDCVAHLGKADYKLFGYIPEEELRVHTRTLWEQLRPVAEKFTVFPEEMPVLFGLAMQQGIDTAAKAISAEEAVGIAMQTALLTAKFDYTRE